MPHARIATKLKDVERFQIYMVYTARQEFARLLAQVHRRRTQQQEPARPDAFAPSFVIENSKRLKQFRFPLDFIQDIKLADLASQVKVGIVQLCEIRRALKIKIYAGPVFTDHTRKRSLASLSRYEQPQSRKLIKPGANNLQFLSRYHPCKSGLCLHKFKDKTNERSAYS